MHSRVAVLWCSIWVLSLLGAPLAVRGDTPQQDSAAQGSYAYATGGILDHIRGGTGSEWKLLIDASNLGGQELEMVEVTLPAGTTVAAHTHGSLEIIYVLSGTYEHEVNGKRYALTPGMIGVVRPGDHVRHLVPASGAAKLLIIWAPGGEAKRVLREPKGTAIAPVPAELSRPSP